MKKTAIARGGTETRGFNVIIDYEQILKHDWDMKPTFEEDGKAVRWRIEYVPESERWRVSFVLINAKHITSRIHVADNLILHEAVNAINKTEEQ